MSQILKQVEKRIAPGEALRRRKENLAESVLQMVRAETANRPEVVGVELGGSFAKGTWLAKKADIDVFIRFDASVGEKEFAELGKKVGFSALKKYKPYIRYAEHPFVEATIKDTKVNLVPCYDVEEGKWKSSADRSPFHTRYMTKSLTDRMKNDVRILKWFLKCNGIYGAEIARQGFSGYVSEVLVLNFGTFEGVLRAISQIKQGQVIGSATKEFDSPLVIIDPIDSNRNLGAAISVENIAKFAMLSRAFLKKPSGLFFKEQKRRQVRSGILKDVLVVSFRYRKRSPDIIWGQLKRAATSIATQISVEGFTVLRRSALVSEDNDAHLVFLLKSMTLDRNRLKTGPEFFVADHADRFIASNRKRSVMMWISDEGKICSLQSRSHTDAREFVKHLIRKNLQSAGISAGLKDDIKRFSIVRGDKVVGKSIKEAISELVSTDEAVFSSN